MFYNVYLFKSVDFKLISCEVRLKMVVDNHRLKITSSSSITKYLFLDVAPVDFGRNSDEIIPQKNILGEDLTQISIDSTYKNKNFMNNKSHL